ncbi:MAG: hypothetical protein OXG24_05865 [Gammaproteobacteria bacterium]|nr:hypothetical protein [Gammaproteobacteria bacterium]
MRVVFSRKGFDSSAGGAPSPIILGQPFSLPIPAKDRSETTYADLDLGQVVEHMTKGRISGDSLCHNDPMFEGGRCYFGQTGPAQSHLQNQKVGLGDVFLFFGLFGEFDGSERHHRIYAYLEVESITYLDSNPVFHGPLRGLRHRHPHTLGNWNANNTLYSGKGNKARTSPDELKLSKAGENLSMWKVPTWLKDAGLSFHGKKELWYGNHTLQTVGRGQEFVTDISNRPEALRWLDSIIDLIEGT